MLIQEIWVQVSEELMKLRKEQEEMESKLKLRVIGLPLFDTILQVYTKKIIQNGGMETALITTIHVVVRYI